MNALRKAHLYLLEIPALDRQLPLIPPFSPPPLPESVSALLTLPPSAAVAS